MDRRFPVRTLAFFVTPQSSWLKFALTLTLKKNSWAQFFQGQHCRRLSGKRYCKGLARGRQASEEKSSAHCCGWGLCPTSCTAAPVKRTNTSVVEVSCYERCRSCRCRLARAVPGDLEETKAQIPRHPSHQWGKQSSQREGTEGFLVMHPSPQLNREEHRT